MKIQDVLKEMRETVNSSDGIAIAEKLIRWEHWTNVEVERLRRLVEEAYAEGFEDSILEFDWLGSHSKSEMDGTPRRNRLDPERTLPEPPGEGEG